jgi:hypothetical protein
MSLRLTHSDEDFTTEIMRKTREKLRALRVSVVN